MQIITGFFIILAHLVAGNLLSELMGGFVPGSVVGMVLMFISLMTGLVKDYQIRRVATFLTDNMTIFFIPAFMGIMELWGIIRMNLFAWIAVVVLSTVLVLMSAAFTQEGMDSMASQESTGGNEDGYADEYACNAAFDHRCISSWSLGEEEITDCASASFSDQYPCDNSSS